MENGGVDAYSVGITMVISCFWHLPTQFVQGCSSSDPGNNREILDRLSQTYIPGNFQDKICFQSVKSQETHQYNRNYIRGYILLET